MSNEIDTAAIRALHGGNCECAPNEIDSRGHCGVDRLADALDAARAELASKHEALRQACLGFDRMERRRDDARARLEEIRALLTDEGGFFYRDVEAILDRPAGDPPEHPVHQPATSSPAAEHEIAYAAGTLDDGTYGERAYCATCSSLARDYIEDCAIAAELAAHNRGPATGSGDTEPCGPLSMDCGRDTCTLHAPPTNSGQDTETAARSKPYLRYRRAGDPCDFGECTENAALIRVNPKGQPGIFMCEQHARISEAAQRPARAALNAAYGDQE